METNKRTAKSSKSSGVESKRARSRGPMIFNDGIAPRLSWYQIGHYAQIFTEASPEAREDLFGPSMTEAATILGVSRQWVYKLVMKRKLHVVTLSARHKDFPEAHTEVVDMISWASIKEYQSANRTPGRKPKGAE